MSRAPIRVRVDEYSVIPLAILAGVVAALADVSPTGDPVIDRVLTGVAVAATVWIAAAAHWWVLVVAAATAVATVGDPFLTGVAAIPLLLGLWIGTRLRSHSTVRCLTAGIVVNLVLRSEIDVFVGCSAIIGIGVAVLMIVSGMIRRSRRQRRWIVGILALGGGLALLGGGALVASAFSVRSTIVDAVDSVRDGVDQLSDGKFDAASASLTSAARDLRRVHDWVDAPWTQPARAIPVLAQHRQAVVDVAAQAARLASVISAEMDVLDLETLTPVRGRIDLGALDRVSTSVDRLISSVDAMSTTIATSRSVWLAAPVTRQLDKLDTDLTRQVESAHRARDAVRLAPAMLGADGTRRYFVAFTSPAEARGGGGFMGSWAEIDIDNGQIRLTRSGRTGALNDAGGPTRSITGPDDFVQRYGDYGFTSGPNGTTARDIWSVVNLSPHFPSTAAVITQLYPQSGGTDVDGVISMDVYALARFLDFTGPITVPGLDRKIDADNAAQFLLYDQYKLSGGGIDRVDVLEAVARQVVTRLLAGALPGPRDLIDALAPMVDQGRLTAFATRPEEEALFETFHMSGALPVPESQESISVSFNNATASKLELFLDATLDYDMVVDSDGVIHSTATFRLRNSAPTSGWPEGVIGNYIGLPTGTNRLWVSVASRIAVDTASVDGTDVKPAVSLEAGLIANDWFIDIAPGTTSTLVISFDGVFDAASISTDVGEIPLVLRLPPMVRPMTATVTYHDTTGETLVAAFDRPGTFRRPMASENLAGK